MIHVKSCRYESQEVIDPHGVEMANELMVTVD